MAEYKGANHPFKRRKNGRRASCTMHMKVWCEHHGKVPKEGYVIHHINGDKKDNRIENLICLSRSEHALIHNKMKKSN